MFGPFGVDAFALTNALSLLQELITRVQAPRELLRTAAYLSDRRSKLLPHLNDDGDAAARSVPLASSKLLDQHAFLVPSQRDQSASGGLLPPRVLRAARIFLTRDSLHDVLQAVSRLQNDELLERLLIKQTQIGLRLDSIENAVNTMPFLSNLISPCSQVESAGKIQNLPVLRLKGLSVRERKDYTSIHTPLPPDSPVSTPTRPIWPPASASPPLFSNSQQLDLRFELLLSVATSLAAAHSFGWYHTFLAPTMIRIPIHPTSAHTHPPVVLNFLHRGKGCKACGSCTENPLPHPNQTILFPFAMSPLP
ncbi:hypothetical protein BWQ96_06203 [Gracilariopsis chorda]|uniref:Uncharacterized protein n=1 Tax=Gracilariopsis chorda TaxID=448386 RepID=A0A2V3ISE9_9FLOR|nr:hypothetical protein BWQ96_06203 [Gracilariopsis chorda]|eukprot:PXF44030.1 hypothetical protein BWQ96_06203 [Gracilariopsis chorda]